jgi:hypothetical protein
MTAYIPRKNNRNIEVLLGNDRIRERNALLPRLHSIPFSINTSLGHLSLSLQPYQIFHITLYGNPMLEVSVAFLVVLVIQ